MIKAALISHTINFAGAEKMLYELGRLLKEKGQYYPVVFLPGVEESSFADKCEEGGLETLRIEPIPWYLYMTSQNAAEVAAQTIQAAEKLATTFREQGIGLVVCNTLTSLVPALAARKEEIPVLLWVHGILDGYFVSGDYDLEWRLLFDRLLMAMSDSVVCCSKWTENYYAQLSSTPISTIGNWSENPSKLVPLHNKKRFVCLNTFDYHKGVYLLLKAAYVLKKRGYNFEVELYGSGPMDAELRTYVSKHKLEKEVTFCGRTNDVTSIYQDCFALVQPCDLEPFGLTITEAMSHGRAVIAMASGGPLDIVADGETGYLIPPRNKEMLAEKMAYFLEHPEAAENMGTQGRQRYLELFSPQRASAEFHEELDRILEHPRSVNAKDVLLEDTLWNMLHLSATMVLPSAQTKGTMVQSPFTGERLNYSRPIRGKRIYRIHTVGGSFTSAALLIAFDDWTSPAGTLSVRVHQDGTVVAAGSVPMVMLVRNDWSYIPLEPKRLCRTGTVEVELTFAYQEGSALLGVYEDTFHRGFLYKMFNRLHFPRKGMDALIIQLS